MLFLRSTPGPCIVVQHSVDSSLREFRMVSWLLNFVLCLLGKFVTLDLRTPRRVLATSKHHLGNGCLSMRRVRIQACLSLQSVHSTGYAHRHLLGQELRPQQDSGRPQLSRNGRRYDGCDGDQAHVLLGARQAPALHSQLLVRLGWGRVAGGAKHGGNCNHMRGRG